MFQGWSRSNNLQAKVLTIVEGCMAAGSGVSYSVTRNSVFSRTLQIAIKRISRIEEIVQKINEFYRMKIFFIDTLITKISETTSRNNLQRY